MRYHVILVCDKSDLYILNRRTLRSALEWCTEAGPVRDRNSFWCHPDVDRAKFVMSRSSESTGKPLSFRILVTDDGIPIESWRVFEDKTGHVSLQLTASSPPDQYDQTLAAVPRLLP